MINILLSKNKYLYLFLFMLLLIQGYFYVNHIVNNFKLINEYRYFDEITLLDKKEVINSEYIENNLLFNPYVKEKYNSTRNVFFPNEGRKGLSFNNILDEIILDDYKINSYKNLLSQFNYNLPEVMYSKKNKILYDDYFGINKVQEDDNSYASYPMLQADTIEQLKEKMQFIKYNIYEQNIQVLDRYYIHENSFMLAPINEMNLGRKYSEIFSQYGFLSVCLVNYVMDFYGGFSINNYEKAKKSIDFTYFFMAVVFIFIFFKDKYLRLVFILFLGIALFGNTYYAFSYAPAVTNSRHLFDLVIIGMLFKYMNSRKNLYLLFSTLFSLASIIMVKDFGQFVFLSMVATLFIPLVISFIYKKEILKFNLTLLIIFIVLGFISFKFYPTMENPSIKYFLDGFYSFPFYQNIVFFIILGIILIQWLFLFFIYDKLEERNYLYSYIFLIFYTQFLLTYFVWHGSFNNIIMYAYIFSLPFLIVYHIFNFKYKVYYSMVLISILSIIYIKYLTLFINDKKNYDNVFETHKIYKWNHERTGEIIATYSFDNFQDSINLINKYSKNDSIFMISKYDNILGILSKKYSGFPFFELRSSIVTKKEFDDIKNKINSEVDILFVDKDIDRDFISEMKRNSFFDLNPLWKKESRNQRIPKLEVLKQLFQDVKNDYKLQEEGKLINVYKRKNTK